MVDGCACCLGEVLDSFCEGGVGELGEVEGVGGAGRPEASLDLQRGRGDLLGGSQDAFEPDAEGVDVGGGGVDEVGGDVGQVAADEVVEVPFGAVGEDADVALLQVVGAALDVAGELHHGVVADVADSQVALDLEDGEPDLDVDASSLPGWGLQDDVFEIVGTEVEGGGGEQGVQIGLHVGFGASGRRSAMPFTSCRRSTLPGTHAP